MCFCTTPQTYIILLTEMGGGWVERNLPIITKHILELVSHPRTISTHIDAVYSRKCISFILRSVFGRLLGESAQFLAARHLCQFVSQTVASSGSQPLRHQSSRDNFGERSEQASSGEKEKDKEKDRLSLQQHMVICAVLEIGALVYSLNTAALPLVIGEGGGGTFPQELVQRKPPLLLAMNEVLRLQQQAPRLAAAWCMFCVGLALPSQLSTLVDFFLLQLKSSKKSLSAIAGYSYALAALLGTVRSSDLGLPSSKAKEVFTFAQELISSGMKDEESGGQLSVLKVQAGWALVGAYISLGESDEVARWIDNAFCYWWESYGWFISGGWIFSNFWLWFLTKEILPHSSHCPSPSTVSHSYCRLHLLGIVLQGHAFYNHLVVQSSSLPTPLQWWACGDYM